MADDARTDREELCGCLGVVGLFEQYSVSEARRQASAPSRRAREQSCGFSTGYYSLICLVLADEHESLNGDWRAGYILLKKSQSDG